MQAELLALPPSTLSTVVTDEIVEYAVANFDATGWQSIGAELGTSYIHVAFYAVFCIKGVKDSALKAIVNRWENTSKSGKYYSLARRIVYQWREEEGRLATVKKFCDALLRCHSSRAISVTDWNFITEGTFAFFYFFILLLIFFH